MTPSRRRWMNPSGWPIRARLTMLYALAFLAAGVVLVVMTYILVAQSMLRPTTGQVDRVPGRVGQGQTTQAIMEAIEEYRSDTLNQLLVWSIVALCVALVLAWVLGWALAGRALRPLQQVTDTARRVADRSLHERIALTGPQDELKELADTFDAMLERLDRSFDAQRNFVANASHELRTPLAVNRTLLEVALGDPEISDDLRRLAPTILATNSRSERLVEGLLTLARSEQAVTEQTPVDLGSLTAAVLDQEKAEVAERGVTVAAELHPAPAAGNGVLLERMVVNLAQNAVRYSGPAGEVRVWTGLWNDRAILQVENTGPILGPYEVDGLFEPFKRGQGRLSGGGSPGSDGRLSGNDGVGLGLSIVRSIVRAHGGTITARRRDEGGLIIRVELTPSITGQLTDH